MEVDRSNRTTGRQEAGSRPQSDEAAPTDSRSTGTQETPDRAVKDDHTPAA